MTSPLYTTSRTLLISLALVFTMGMSAPELLNVSYDPTRELYQEFNTAFTKAYQAKTAVAVRIRQSHGGSGKQARAVIEGLEADVVTLALAYDIDVIAAKANLLSPDWRKKLPNHGVPITSTIHFLVRKGNPKGIKDWGDLVKPGVAVITPNPKTSGGARWNYLAAWAWASKNFDREEPRIRAFVGALLKNVPVLDSGARGSTLTFAQRGLGDVLLSWESEADLVRREFGTDPFEVVYPSLSILAEPPVAVVESVAKKHGNLEIAKAYLEYLYSPAGQEIAARHGFRPTERSVAAKFASKFPAIRLVTIDEAFGGWQKAQQTHFSDGGTFDQLFRRESK
ncbi:MAG: sulfate ABC transporter substrate-binding protein [Spirochaetes bacterium]|nr:sulfate ABC transporter substrate-binding protein [Spirochaetota bacterium]